MGNVEVVQGGLFLPSGDYVFEVLWSRIVGEGLADKEPTLELGLKVISGQFKGSQITERFAIKANPLRIGYGSKAHALVKATIGVSKARQDDGFHPVRSFPRRRFSGFLVAQEASQGVYLRRGTIAPPPRGVNPVAASKLTVLKMVRKPQATEVKAGV